MKLLKHSWMLFVILAYSFFFVSCYREDDFVDENQQIEAAFQRELDQAFELGASVWSNNTGACRRGGGTTQRKNNTS